MNNDGRKFISAAYLICKAFLIISIALQELELGLKMCKSFSNISFNLSGWTFTLFIEFKNTFLYSDLLFPLYIYIRNFCIYVINPNYIFYICFISSKPTPQLNLLHSTHTFHSTQPTFYHADIELKAR